MDFIAKKTGFSRYTISRALSNNSKVLPQTRKRILEECEKYGYIPNRNAVGLVKGRTTLIGVVVPYLTDDFYSEFIEVLDYVSVQRDYQLVYRSSYNNSALEAEIVKNFLSLKVCAMIIVPVVNAPNQRIHEIARKNVPVVYFDRPLNEDCYHVINDNCLGVKQITETLINAGRSPAYLGSFYYDTNRTARERKRGYCEAMQEHGLSPSLVECSYSQEQQDNERFGYENLRQTLTRGIIPDALICVTDAVALGAMRALNEDGIIIGKDILVTGHDNLRFSAFLSPSLTTIRQRNDLFARTCIDIIDEYLQGRKPDQKQYMFAPEIIRRESA